MDHCVAVGEFPDYSGFYPFLKDFEPLIFAMDMLNVFGN